MPRPTGTELELNTWPLPKPPSQAPEEGADNRRMPRTSTVRWAERFCQVPDGPSVGQPFRLLEFQREVIRGIYRDPRYWSAVTTVLKNGRRRKVATATPRQGAAVASYSGSVAAVILLGGTQYVTQ